MVNSNNSKYKVNRNSNGILSQLITQQNEWLKSCETSQYTLIIAALELPVKVVRLEESPTETEPRFALETSQLSLMRTLHRHRRELASSVRFIGWPGIHPTNEEEKQEITVLLETIDCIPVFPPIQEFEIFNEFCHMYLWSLFHNVLNTEELYMTPFDHDQWRVYHQINMLWSSIITPIVSPDHMDMVWVNDYHLLLLSQYLARKVKGINIGLFLHIPFPSYEIFRCLPVREELLRSMLWADLIGFHFFPYAKQFLSSCKRLLGIDHYFKPGGLIGIDNNCSSGVIQSLGNESLSSKQETLVRIGHVHIQCDDILQMIYSNIEIRKQALTIREKYHGHYIFGSIDRLDQLSGLHLKLKAFDNFLQNYPYLKHKQPVVLIQYIFPTSTLTAEKREKLIQELFTLVNEINSKHSPSFPENTQISSPYLSRESLYQLSESSSTKFQCEKASICSSRLVIELKFGSISHEEKYALFLAADCLFDTSVRDGLNVNPFEYIACKDPSFKLSSVSNSISPFPSSSSSSEHYDTSDNEDLRDTKKILDKTQKKPFYNEQSGYHTIPSLIISEFTGCSKTLSSPYRINPWNVMNVMETLDKAVSLNRCSSQQEKYHWKMDRAYLLSHSTVTWAKEFIMDLGMYTKKKKKEMLYYTTCGLGPSLRGISMDMNFRHLNLNLLIHKYKRPLIGIDSNKNSNKSGLRLFLLDNEGTLTQDYRSILGERQGINRHYSLQSSYKKFYKSNMNLDSEKSDDDLLNIINKCNFEPKCIPKRNDALENISTRSEYHEISKSMNLAENKLKMANNLVSQYKESCIEELEAYKNELGDLYSNDISCNPPEYIKESLRRLCSSPNNIVIIISGRERNMLDEWFGDIENLGLCAEHGYYFKLPPIIETEEPNVWKQLDISTSICSSTVNVNGKIGRSPLFINRMHSNNGLNSGAQSKSDFNLTIQDANKTPSNSPNVSSDILRDIKTLTDVSSYNSNPTFLSSSLKSLDNIMEWKNIAYELMEQYVLRTQGAYIENKGTALVFQYKYCDLDFGSWQAKELSNYLTELMFNYPVDVISGSDYVEVRLSGINKGMAVQLILKKIENIYNDKFVDFILCIGDDRSDEDMFFTINQLYSTNNAGNYVSNSNHPLHSCTNSNYQVSTLLPNINICDDLLSSCDEDLNSISSIFTVVVGKHPSVAHYYVHSVEEVTEVLQTLSMTN
ncbi:trehalose-6-phosphate synthase domain-containing protein [Cryptosporidium muris RN66]|uniref:Trehalose-6-phosphate synthase domain-containing protein n=1 Tax=Cryptosporidium muris (strain RN66) TaxID=441375 RepID=B6AJ03_CRYMR|nr:trehalose-6-phosphate synthase domain-containing protein [Cryptosporidium muris RN66]EEA08194.1 trehalose-6-phosphate synthase domain-containing protein [Cryptosporidium muris RN66]|eukprot:XP_002142543.1 trehalose-6-phosphate synthase domain-containing protein [Cryptosporidium muris RN66]